MLRLSLVFTKALLETLRARRERGPARPNWSFQFECIITFLRNDWSETHRWPYPKLRAELESRPLPQDAIKQVRREATLLADMHTECFVPPGAPEHRAVLYLHGGSYLFGSSRTHADVMARLALASRVRVYGVNYRLAPEHRYPAQRDDALAAFDALVARGFTPGSIVLAGDSAGGNLALVTQLALRERGTQAAAVALISPWLDLSSSMPSTQTPAPLDYGTREALLYWARDVAGTIPLDDPRLSPYFADPAGLAPLYVQAGTAELLLDECVTFAERASAAGVDCTLELLEHMPHNGPTLAGFHPEGARGVASVGDFVRAHLNP